MSDFVFYDYGMIAMRAKILGVRGKSIDYAMVLVECLKPTYKTSIFMDSKKIALDYGFPIAFLEKVARRLRHAGVLESRRGIGGGYRLVADPQSVNIQTIANLFESPFQYCPVTRYRKNA